MPATLTVEPAVIENARPRPEGERRGRFRPVDLLKQVLIQEVALAPDGESVVYSRRTIENGTYRKRLWRVAWRGGQPEALTTTDANGGQPRFSPDGRAMLFLSDRSEKSQPWLLPLGGGEPRRLCEIEGNVRAAAWSPDGRSILLLAPSGEERFIIGDPKDPIARRITDATWRWDGLGVRDQFVSLWVVSAAGGKPRRLTAPTYEVTGACWSPDSRRIAFTADLRPEAGLFEQPHAWTIAVEGEAAPEPAGTLTGSVDWLSWSPAGHLVLIGNNTPFAAGWATTGLFVVADDPTQPRQLAAELDRPIANTTYGDLIDPTSDISGGWLDDETLVALVTDRGAVRPYRFNIRSGEFARLVGGELVCSAVATGGGRVVVVATDAGRAGEVYAVEAGRLRSLTRDGSRWLTAYRRDPKRQTIRHPDGHDLDTFVIPAATSEKPGRLVIQIHGGPHASHGPTPWLEMLALADAGIGVLYPNPRGSTSYGEAFAKAIHGCWGEPDAADLLVLADWAIERGIADPKRIGVLGLSGGGFMVNWLLGHHPGRFAAGVSENPVTDFVGMFGESDIGAFPPERFIGIPPLPDGIEHYLRRSPYTHLHRNEAPLLLLQCDQDRRCPPGQTELAFTLLRSRGRPVEMVRYPDEPHYLCGIGRPDRRVDRLQRIVDWFARYL